MEKEDLAAAISGLITALSTESLNKYSELSGVLRSSSEVTSALEKVVAGDYDALEFSIMYPLTQGIKALALEKGISERAWFVIENSRFFESQFSALFSKFEGRICCVDKARTIIRKLIKHFNTGAQIELDYSQEYTFGLPGLF